MPGIADQIRQAAGTDQSDQTQGQPSVADQIRQAAGTQPQQNNASQLTTCQPTDAPVTPTSGAPTVQQMSNEQTFDTLSKAGVYDQGAPMISCEQLNQTAKGFQQGEQQTQNTATQTEQALGAKYDPNALSLAQREKLGAAPNFGTEQEAFTKMFPEGSMEQVKGPTGEAFIKFKTSADGQPALLSPGSVKAWSDYYNSFNTDLPSDQRVKLIGRALMNTMADNPRETVDTVLLTLLTGPGGFIRNAARVMGGSVVSGQAMDQPYRQENDASVPSYAATLTRDAWNGTIATAGYLVGALGNGINNLTHGAGIVKLSPEGKSAMEALDRLKDIMRTNGVPEEELNHMNYLPTQVTDIKLLQRFANVMSRLIGSLEEHVKGQKLMGEQSLSTAYDKGDVEKNLQTKDRGWNETKSGTIPEGVQTYRNSALEGDRPASPDVSHIEAAKGLNDELGTYADRSQKTVSDLYKQRDDILKKTGASPQYDPSPALDAADKAEKGTPQPYTQPAKQVPTSLLGPNGQPLGNITQPPKQAVNQIEPLKGDDINDVVNGIRNWKNSTPVDHVDANGKVTTVADQINAFQRRLYDLSRPDPLSGAVRLDPARAQIIRNGLQQMLDNPSGPGTSYLAYQKANEAAKNAARGRFETLDNPLLARGYKQSEGDLVTPGSASIKTMLGETGRQVENLQQLEKWSQQGVISPGSYQKVIDSEKTKLLANPDTLKTTLDKMDPEFKKQIFKDPNELSTYSALGDIYDRLNKSGIQQAVANQTKATQVIRQLIQTGQTNGNTYTQLKKIVDMNPDSDLGKTLRAGVLDNFLRETAHIDRGNIFLDTQKFDSYLETKVGDPVEGKLLQFLTRTDMQHVKDLQMYLQTIGRGENSLGASFQAYAEAGQISKLEHEAIIGLIENYGLSQMMVSPKWQKIFYGSGKTGMTSEGGLIKRIAVAATAANTSKKDLSTQTSNALGGTNGSTP